MVHAVDLDSQTMADIRQPGSGNHRYMVGRNSIRKGLLVCNRKVLGKLAGNILVYGTAQADVDKLGGGLGTAVAGWLLEFSKFDGKLAVQPESCINMLHIMYLWLPLIINIIIMLILSRMNVEGANEKLRSERARNRQF